MTNNEGYNPGHQLEDWSVSMPRKKVEGETGFGERLAQLRKAAGFTQAELAAELGLTQRNIAYYEGETQHPPGSLLVQIAKALGVTTDELLGAIPIRRAGRPASTRLQRRLSAIEKLEPKEKRQIMAFLDTFIEREQLKKKAGA
jgi:transcriptional regulator with XRE-family HTH domain